MSNSDIEYDTNNRADKKYKNIKNCNEKCIEYN